MRAVMAGIASAVLLSVPGALRADTYLFHVIGAGYQDYGLNNNAAGSGYSFINQANRTWLSPDGVVKADQVPLVGTYDKTYGQAINEVHWLAGEIQDFGPPVFRAPMLWDASAGTRVLDGLTAYNVSFGPTDPANPRSNLAMDVTDDGALVCGYGWSPINEHPWVAWVWTPADSFRTLPVDADYFVPQALWIDEPAGIVYGLAQDGAGAWYRVCWIPSGSLAVAADQRSPGPPRVGAPSPNPFSDRTRFPLAFPPGIPLRAAVFDGGGRRIAVLEPGGPDGDECELGWDGHGPDGRPVPAGCYFIVVETPGSRDVRKVMLLP